MDIKDDTPKKTRRYHSPEFKAKIVELCRTSGQSRAAIAREYARNDNLIHKWCQDAKRKGLAAKPSFIELPTPQGIAKHLIDPLPSGTVTFELALTSGKVVSVYWPLSGIEQSIPWLKALDS